MPLDAPLIAAVATEINALLPVKTDRIHQPHPEEFIWTCYGMGHSFKLLFSLHSRYARLHLYEGAIENSTNVSPFCTVLRKYFTGSKLINVASVSFERIIRLTFEVYQEPIGLTKKEIYLELTGKSSNLIITDENGIIVDLWRKSGGPQSRERELAVDAKYEVPSTGGRWKPVTVSRADFITLAAQLPPEVTPPKFLLKHWYGLSTTMANEIIEDAGLKPDLPCHQYSETDFAKLYDSFQDWADSVKSGKFEPCCLYSPEGKPVDCSALPIHHPEGSLIAKAVPSINQAVAAVFVDRQETERFSELKNSWLKKVQAPLNKTRTKLGKQEQEAAQAEQGDEWRIMGELLTTYGSQIQKGNKSARLTNHYDPENSEIEIPLNPALSVWDNAQHYFKKYHKAKKGQLAIAAQLAKTRESLDYLESIETMVLNAVNQADLKLIQEEWELANNKQVKKANPSSKKKEAPAEPRQFQTPAGHTLLVGRNNLQNDRLTFKIADPTDWWFHTQKIPGSHVILRPKPGIAVDDETLNFACQLAAYFSKARQSTKIPVDYTQRKYVKKPPASKPGFVIYDNFKTAIITPDMDLLEALGIPKEVGTNLGS